MFFKKLDLPSIPENLKKEIIKDFEKSYKNPPPVSFDLYKKDSGSVSIYPMSTHLQMLLSRIYKNTILDNYIFTFQVVEGGEYVSPHIDPDTHRSEAYYYILNKGDTPAKTVWYKNLSDEKLNQAIAINYDNLEIVDELVAENDNWYWFKLNEIHSVENLSGRRLMIFCLDKAEVHKYIK